MPSNREVGFDPEWNEERRLEYYRAKAEREIKKFKPPDLAKPVIPSQPIRLHPFDIISRYIKMRDIPMFLDENGGFSIEIDKQEPFPYRFFNLCNVTGIDIHWKED